jgi:hypothetical protein
LREQLNLLARRHPRYGCRRVHVLLQQEGRQCNRKRVQRLWRDEGLHVPRKTHRRKKAPRTPRSVTARSGRSTTSSTPLLTTGRSKDLQHHRRAHLRGPRLPRRPLDQRRPDRRRPRQPRPRPTGTRPYPLRQRPRTRRRDTQRLVPLDRRHHQLHRAGRPWQNPLRRILQRPPPPGTPRTRVLSATSTKPRSTGGGSTTTTGPPVARQTGSRHS